MANSYPRQINCADCAEAFTSKTPAQIRCPVCQKRRDILLHRKYKKKCRDNKNVQPVGVVTVVRDPGGDEYGFPAGAEFGVSEARLMLAERCFTPGTLVEYRGKRHVIVCSGRRQTMVKTS